MKNRCFHRPTAWCMFFVSFAGMTHGETLRYWNASGSGGDGIWGTGPGDKNWNLVSGALAGNTAWQDGIDDVAVFQDASGGTVTVFDTVQTAGIIQNGANYTIDAGSIVLAPDSASNAPFVNVQGGILTMNAPLAGNSGLLKTGGGTLLLNAANPYTGTTAIQGGTVNLAGSLASNTILISSGATLLNQNGGLSNTTTLTNAGSLTLNANDTIESYTSYGGTLTQGPGTLFTTSAELNDGSSVDGRLNTVTLASNGVTSINGIATAGSAFIQGGKHYLNGTLESDAVQIASGASFYSVTGGLAGSATLTNEGTLALMANDTIATYVSNGGTLFNGPGTLFAGTAELNNGSSIQGRLNAGFITSNGTVTLSNMVAGMSMTTVQSGTLTLIGTLTTPTLNIASGASLIQNGTLGPSSPSSAVTVVTNQGSLILGKSAVFKTYLSNGGLLDILNGRMITQTVMLNDGSITKGGSFSADLLTTNGAVRIENNALSARALVASGTLDLSGSLGTNDVEIAIGASLLNQNGGLRNTATVTNAGSLVLLNSDQIATYTSNGGTLANSPGTLFSNSATLNDGSILAGLLDTGTLTSSGAVQVTGNISADRIDIATGTLTNTGTLGNVSTLLHINQGATLAAGGIQQYSLLTTSGGGPATWSGDLDNTSAVAPGGVGEVGILAIEGNFSQSPAGTLRLDLTATDNDLLDVTGSATFNGSLELNQLGTAIAPFVPVTVVSATGYAGNISSLSENLDGAVWFNPGNGTVTRIELPAGGGGSFFGATRNQTSTWISLYDDVIDPGITNITSGPGGYDISSGIADAGNPDLLWALAASFTPDGLNAALLNRLSPEVYGGLSDYAMQATRSHQRSALSAPALDPREKSASSAKDGAKAGVADAAAFLDWEFFAAVDYFRAGTDNSHNQADSDFDGMGVISGARTSLRDQTQLAVYFGADSGTIDGALIDADAFGWNFGVIGERLLDEKSRTRLTAGMSYGSYAFDGTRGSASVSATGWLPGKVDFDNVDVGAFDLFIGVDGVAWKQDALTLVPSARLRYAMTTMDSFTETTGGAPGSPIALDVSRDRHESLLLELGLLAQVEVNPKLSLWGEGGLNIGLLNDGRTLGASFAKGSRGMRAQADGLDDDSFHLGCGAVYQISDDISAAIGYRADVRSGAKSQQELRLSSSWRF